MNKFFKSLILSWLSSPCLERLSSSSSFHLIWEVIRDMVFLSSWQREIGIWNLAVLVILIAINLKYDWFYLRTGFIGLDHWWAWDWDQSFICLSQLSFASKCYWSF